MNRKSVQAQSFKLTDEGEGSFEAVFATLNVRDKDGDVIVPGSIENGEPVRISAYNHSSWGGALPVGKGKITEENDELVVRGKFFKTTDAGRETYNTVKELDDLTEWSFGFDTIEAESGELDGKRVNFLRKLKVYEVSPVLLGAGINTRTTAIKTLELPNYGDDDVSLSAEEIKGVIDYVNQRSLAHSTDLSDPEAKIDTSNKDQGDEDMPDTNRQKAYDDIDEESKQQPQGGFKRHILTVREAVKDVAERSQEIKRLRVADGRDFGSERKQDLRELAEEMRKAAAAIETATKDEEEAGVLLLAKIRDEIMGGDHEY